MSLQDIRSFGVPAGVVDTTDKALREAGEEGYELFVLWTGTAVGSHFEVEHAYVPTQRSFRGHEGLQVRVAGKDLHDLNRWLYEHRQTLAVQVHSHPTKAYHSDTDDQFPIVTALGGLSIVVPHFGKGGIRGPGVVAYRLGPRSWSKLSSSQSDALMRFAS
jgi:hypothetical protein